MPFKRYLPWLLMLINHLFSGVDPSLKSLSSSDHGVRHYIEIVIRDSDEDGATDGRSKRPQVRGKFTRIWFSVPCLLYFILLLSLSLSFISFYLRHLFLSLSFLRVLALLHLLYCNSGSKYQP